MELSKVTREDGLACAHLINFLKVGRWDLTGEESDRLTHVKQWVQKLALEMANQLRAVEPAPATPPSSSMRVKSMGPLPTSQGTGPKSSSTGAGKKRRK